MGTAVFGKKLERLRTWPAPRAQQFYPLGKRCNRLSFSLIQPFLDLGGSS